MVFLGIVRNGLVVLDNGAMLPEGAQVRVELVCPPPNKGEVTGQEETLYDRLKPFIGVLDDLPPDMSVNLDHYLYGVPKRQP